MRAWRFQTKMRSAANQMAWLRVLVRNEAARFYRHGLAPPTGPVLEAADDERLGQTLLRTDLARAMSKLTQAERQIVILRYQEDMTQPAIAEALGMPEGTVKVRLHRARQKLRDALDDT